MSDVKTPDQMAEELAEAHYSGGMEVDEIYRLDSDVESDDKTVRLLEITPDTVPAGIAPVVLGTHSASGMIYPSVVVTVTPEEFTDELRERLRREYGWTVGRKYQKPTRSKRVARK